MAQAFKERICEVSTSTGTGPMALSGAITAHKRFGERVAIGDTFYGEIAAVDANNVETGEWEAGFYTYSANDVVTRTTVRESSNADNSAVVFSPGRKLIYLCLTAYQLSQLTVSAPAPAPAPETGTPGANDTIAAGGAFSQVQAAVNATADGATCWIPQGTHDWGTSELLCNAGIHLRGAGKDMTILLRRGTVGQSSGLIRYNHVAGKKVTISNMTLEGDGHRPNMPESSADRGLILMNGCQDFQVYDCKFTKWAFTGIFCAYSTSQRGVIYRCDFIDCFNPHGFTTGKNLGYGIQVHGPVSTGAYPPLDLGSVNAVFVEDCFMSGQRHHIVGNAGAAYVFRRNQVRGTTPVKDYAMVDMHGKESGTASGGRSYEIYSNELFSDVPTASGALRTGCGIRGGDGVIFNNIIHTEPHGGSSGIKVGIELSNDGGCANNAAWRTKELHIWGNTIAANTQSVPEGSMDADGILNQCPSQIIKNTHYFLSPRPGYTPYPYPHPGRTG